MPDWEHLVAGRLAHLKLSHEVRREVIAEIAGHLEDCYQALRAAGSPDPEGYTLAQVADWEAFSRKIRRAKEGRMSFSRKVMIPGLAGLFLAQVSLSLLHHTLVALHGDPTVSQFRTSFPATPGAFYLPWLAALPFAGALGAWLARRSGARPAQRLAAALFQPILAVVTSTLFGIVALLINPQKLISEFQLANQAAVILFWVIIPAIACSLGACPFLAGTRRAEPQPPTNPARA
jgi:hypothetical protein